MCYGDFIMYNIPYSAQQEMIRDYILLSRVVYSLSPASQNAVENIMQQLSEVLDMVSKDYIKNTMDEHINGGVSPDEVADFILKLTKGNLH